VLAENPAGIANSAVAVNATAPLLGVTTRFTILQSPVSH
jgi:hypothetical protein